MSFPDETPEDALSGDLGTVTDEEWREAHERLMADEPELAESGQLAYMWRPQTPGDRLISPHEREIAPRAGDWREGDRDERFEGGGFRG